MTGAKEQYEPCLYCGRTAKSGGILGKAGPTICLACLTKDHRGKTRKIRLVHSKVPPLSFPST